MGNWSVPISHVLFEPGILTLESTVLAQKCLRMFGFQWSPFPDSMELLEGFWGQRSWWTWEWGECWGRLGRSPTGFVIVIGVILLAFVWILTRLKMCAMLLAFLLLCHFSNLFFFWYGLSPLCHISLLSTHRLTRLGRIESKIDGSSLLESSEALKSAAIAAKMAHDKDQSVHNISE